VRELLSPHRLRPYLDQSDGDPQKALQLYEWSARMAAAAFESVAHLEVMMRNSTDAVALDGGLERLGAGPSCQPAGSML
jgi:hypothetical protein